MDRSKQIRVLFLLAVGLAGARYNCAQEPTQEPPAQQEPSGNLPKPAGRGIPGLSDDQSTDQSNDRWQPDTSPVTGLETPTLGSPSLRHSYWMPGLQYGGTARSNPFGASGSSNWYGTNYIGGSLTLVKAWSGSLLNLNYSGGGVVTTNGGQGPDQGNGSYQELTASQSFQSRRWLWQFFDQFSYLPDTQFGFGGGTGLETAGVGGTLAPTMPGGLAPNQSIVSATGPRYSNSFIAQGTYTLNRRQSITMAGMDGILHYTQAQNVDSANYLGSMGYNYALTREDSIGLMYYFSAFHFSGQAQAYGESAVSAAYQRKVTQRLALQLAGGPSFISYRVPVGGISKRTSGQGSATLTYGLRRAGLGVSYFHGLSGGSGVLIGGNLDQVTFSGSRQISRIWSANANFGYARNRALNAALSVGAGSYDNYFVGGGVSRPFGRNVDFAVSYTAYIQRVGQGSAGPVSNATTTQHTITMFLNWHTRPLVIE